ncbi:MAG TPA: cbb3-type cytochrome c oxidase subunit I [Gemmatimonadales bacterium]|nr:cbb3-type cytochrome c oxidase subunit I [Gemmatimonadales bacterium]
MNPLVRRYLKTAIVFLLLGLLLGGWMIVRRELYGRYPTPYLVSAHTHLLLVGFVLMMVMGVALWMFPRPAREDVRYRPELAGLAYWLVTASTAVRAFGEVTRTAVGSAGARWAVALAGIGQIAGLAVFFYNLWPRIRSPGARAREERPGP